MIFRISFNIFDKYYFKTSNKNQDVMNKIGILGSGWLGSALAEKAQKKGHEIWVTTTTEGKVNTLQNKGFHAQFLRLSESTLEGTLDFFNDIDTLVITIPPGLRKNPQRNYVALIEQIIEKTESYKIQRVLFTSSTSVYGFQKGIITETSELLGATPSAKQIIDVEQKLLKNKNFESCIVRLGGLMGPERHPIFTLSGKKNLPNPLSPINFIHREDATAILLQIVENWKGNQTYNAVTPFHPSRKEYYTQMAKMAQLSPPKFEETGTIRGIISSEKVVFELNCQFTVKNLLILN
jgi:nucleoside-diphosphate-sugar epimerase